MKRKTKLEEKLEELQQRIEMLNMQFELANRNVDEMVEVNKKMVEQRTYTSIKFTGALFVIIPLLLFVYGAGVNLFENTNMLGMLWFGGGMLILVSDRGRFKGVGIVMMGLPVVFLLSYLGANVFEPLNFVGALFGAVGMSILATPKSKIIKNVREQNEKEAKGQ